MKALVGQNFSYTKRADGIILFLSSDKYNITDHESTRGGTRIVLRQDNSERRRTVARVLNHQDISLNRNDCTLTNAAPARR